MVDSFSVLFAIQEVAFIFVLIGVDDFSFVGGPIIDPFPVVNSPAGVL